MSDAYFPEQESQESRDLVQLDLEKIDRIVQNCDLRTAEKILNIIDDKSCNLTDYSTQKRLKNLLSRDEITGKDVPEWQAGKILSISMLVLSLIIISASLYWTPKLIEKTDLNVLELVEVTSLISFIITACILLTYTWKPKEIIDTD